MKRTTLLVAVIVIAAIVIVLLLSTVTNAQTEAFTITDTDGVFVVRKVLIEVLYMSDDTQRSRVVSEVRWPKDAATAAAQAITEMQAALGIAP